MSDFTIGPPLGLYSRRTWGGELPPAPQGAQAHFMVTATSNGVHATHNLVVVLPKMHGPIHLAIECVAHNFAPPESDAQRRRRRVREALVTARASGKLGLTTDDETSTVDAILSALDGEFAEEPPDEDDHDEDHDPDYYRDQDDD